MNGIDKAPSFYKDYYIDDPFGKIHVKAHPKSCFFCKHLSDMLYDFMNGPYMFMCEFEPENEDDQCPPEAGGLKGECSMFEEGN